MSKEFEGFSWFDECEASFNVLKLKFGSASIIVCLDWNNKFHVHIHASGIYFGVVLAQLKDSNHDHPI